VLEREGSPEALLDATYRTGDAATAIVCRPTSSALVLGSAQHESDFDPVACRAAGLDVVRRRGGGGAVIVRPGAQVWVDFFVPRGDPLFSDDVLASFAFVGEIWTAAILATRPSLSAGDISVATGRAKPTSWSKTLCFGGVGAGELTVHGRKVVGVSQRRDRTGAWFHSMALLEFDPHELVALLSGPELLRREAAAWLARSAAAVPSGSDTAPSLMEAVVGRLA
jgi:lipoate-protein ligase A